MLHCLHTPACAGPCFMPRPERGYTDELATRRANRSTRSRAAASGKPLSSGQAPAELKRARAGAAKLIAQARRVGTNTTLDVSELLLAVFAAMLAASKAAGSPSRRWEAIMSAGREHPESGPGLGRHRWFAVRLFVAIVRFVGDEDNLELRADIYGRAQALLEAYRRRCEQTGHSTGWPRSPANGNYSGKLSTARPARAI